MESLNNNKFIKLSEKEMDNLKGGSKFLGYQEVVQFKDSIGNVSSTSEQLFILWIGTAKLRLD